MAAPKRGRKKPPGQAVEPRNNNVIELVTRDDPAPELPVKNAEPEVVKWWDELWSSPVASAIDTSDMDMLRRLATYKNDWQKLRRVIDSETAYGGYVTEGSMGQMVESPFVKQLQKVETLIGTIESKFGGDPLSRLKLGITLTDAAKANEELREIMGGPDARNQIEAEEVNLEDFA